MISVTHLSTFADHGGAGHAVYQLHRSLPEYGINSRLLTLAASEEDRNVQHVPCSPDLLNRVLSKVGMEPWQQRLPRCTNPEKAIAMFSDRSGPCTDVRSHIPEETDILQVNWISRWLDWDSFFKSAIKTPVVWRFADMNQFTGGCHYSFDCNKFTNACWPCPQVIGGRAPQRRIARNLKKKRTTLRRFQNEKHVVVAQSHWMATQSQQSTVFDGIKTIVIPNGVDTTRFRRLDQQVCRQCLNISPDHYVGLLFGGSSPRKGSHQLASELLRRMPKNATLLAVGEFPNSIRNEPYVVSLPDVPQQLLPIIYSAADVLLFPSLQDNCSNTVLEAQACGRPVLAFDNSGTRELIVDSQTGWLLPDRNFHAFADQFIRLVYSNTRPDGQQIAATVRTLPDMVADYATLYRSLVT